MSRKQRSKEELVEASGHLHYEYSMLIGLANVQFTGAFGVGIINNALLESFSVHSRILLHFLYSRKPREDDVIAEDFLDDEDIWLSNRPQKSETLEAIHRRVGKEVAHLTYARHDVTPETKPWPFIEIANEVNSIFTEFIKLVPPKNLDPIWRKS
jgi:hypothetical protein